jgi:hypothetical protein
MATPCRHDPDISCRRCICETSTQGWAIWVHTFPRDERRGGEGGRRALGYPLVGNPSRQQLPDQLGCHELAEANIFAESAVRPGVILTIQAAGQGPPPGHPPPYSISRTLGGQWVREQVGRERNTPAKAKWLGIHLEAVNTSFLRGSSEPNSGTACSITLTRDAWGGGGGIETLQLPAELPTWSRDS